MNQPARATGREGGGTPFSSRQFKLTSPTGKVGGNPTHIGQGASDRALHKATKQGGARTPRLAGREGRARGTHVGLGLFPKKSQTSNVVPKETWQPEPRVTGFVRRPTGRQLRKLHPSRNPKAKTLFGTANPTPLPGHEDRGGAKKTNPKLRSLKRNDEALWGTYIDLALLLERKKKQGGEDWIQKAVNPEHEGYCTPMTKSTCTPRRKAFAETMKAHKGFQK